MLTLTWLLLGVGVLCLVISLRGRLVSKELHCGKCGYHLGGINRVPQTMCPECGHGVWVGAVTRCVRKTYPKLLRVSLLLFAFSVLAMGLSVVERFIGLDWYRVRGTTELKDLVADSGAVENHERAWRELLRRNNAGTLTKEDVDEIAASAMDRHISMLVAPVTSQSQAGNQPRNAALRTELGEHHAAWLDLICNQRLTDAERSSAYVESLLRPVLSFHMQKRAVQESYLSLRVYVRCDGLGGYEGGELAVWLEDMTANGRPYQPQGWTSIVDTVAVRPKGGGADSLWVQIPMDLEPGHHLMKFRLRAGITQMDIGHGPTGFAAGGLLRAYDKWPATLWETTVEYAQSIEVLPASARDR